MTRGPETDARGSAAGRNFVLFDVDGTLVDAVQNQRRVWGEWALHHRLNPEDVYEVALRTRPVETFAIVAPDRDARACLRVLSELEDEDVRSGSYAAFAGAAGLLQRMPPGCWGLVTSNYEHRVRGRFARTGLPMPALIIDAACVDHGKPAPDPYLLAAKRLGASPNQCLVVEDAPSGVEAGLRAGMTVWSVNGRAPVPGSHRHFPTLADASAEILAFVSGTQSTSPPQVRIFASFPQK